MEQEELQPKEKYPWKAFLIFLGIYILTLVIQYPVLVEQGELFMEIFNQEFTYTPQQYALTALIQPLLLGIIAIYFGHRYAQKLNLRSLITKKVEPDYLSDTTKQYTLKESIPFVVTIAVGVALLELGFDVVFQNWLPEFYQPNFVIPTIAQALSSIFYGGLGQELLLRFGVMTSIVYVLSSKGERLNEWSYIIGFVFTGILFAFAQYSSVAGFIDLNAMVILRILVLSALPGILYGWLYSSFHLEAAIISHMSANALVVFGHSVIVGLSEL